MSAKPEVDHTRHHSADELRDSGLGHLRDAMALLESKATAEERDDYRHFVLAVANKVATAHRQHGQQVNPADAEAIPADHDGARPADVARDHLRGVNRGAGCLGFNDRMVVIFGFGPGSPEDQGEVAPCVCPNCHNQVFLHHVRSKKSVRLYFVPVVPYGTDDYLVCPVCSRGVQVSGAQLRQVRSMSSATASFRAGRLPPARYMAQAERFLRQLGVNPAGQQVLTLPSAGAPGSARPAVRVTPAAPAPAAPPAADDQTPWISHLHQLAQLHNQGVLSDAAYAAAKRRILRPDKQRQPPGPNPPPTS